MRELERPNTHRSRCHAIHLYPILSPGYFTHPSRRFHGRESTSAHRDCSSDPSSPHEAVLVRHSSEGRCQNRQANKIWPRAGDLFRYHSSSAKGISSSEIQTIWRYVPFHCFANSPKLTGDCFISVLYHHGLSATGGHYTLDVLHPNRDNASSAKPRAGWMRIDDEFVSDVRYEDVFGGLDRDDRCAYLLFYQRIGESAGGSVRSSRS